MQSICDSCGLHVSKVGRIFKIFNMKGDNIGMYCKKCRRKYKGELKPLRDVMR